ncbi:uncharacterized protein TM35_000016890 [Trypanosoma theileri]|uniref:Uncharacterized protein n=1 Tax=Trypanosoma theileri TaxID=67003 RepID=A0A1X0PA58_9TRYP|nr:uncharacterized protein TM35_000016890 [Trypanosoma theileri]ORC93812.1 hypothetical protein TM35_000016890 [Trypanosoma theileri]
MFRCATHLESLFVKCVATPRRVSSRYYCRSYTHRNAKPSNHSANRTSTGAAGVATPPIEESTNKTTSQNEAQEDVGPSRESVGRRLFTSWQQGVVASIGAVMGIGAICFFFYAPVKEDTVHHTAVVASEALGDVRLREQAIQLSKAVVESVLNDQKTLELVVRLVVQLLRQDDTMIAVSSFLRALFEDHYTQEVSKKFVLMTVLDPWIQEQLRGIAKDLAKGLLCDPEIKEALVNLLTVSAATSLQDEELRCDAARAVRLVAKLVINPWS